jgi:integrase
MPKKGNGKGSIYPHKRNGKRVGHRGSYWVHTAEGPKRRYLSGKTREEVHDKLIKALGNRAQGLVFDAGNLTFGEYLARWLKDSVKGTVRSSTFEVHRHMIEPHIVPAFGAIKLKDLNPAHVRVFYREKRDSGLSAVTVRKLHSVLHKALKQAVLDGLIPRNVCEAVKPPKVERKEIKPLDRDQARALLEAACSDRLEALYVLAIHTGMREGEFLGLKWEDVDLERGLLRLRRSLVRQGGKTTLGDLKTPKSRRSVRLTRVAADVLRSHLEHQQEEMERIGSLYQPGGLVFATESGTLINPSNLRNRSFKPLLERAGSPDICFHDLRYSSEGRAGRVAVEGLTRTHTRLSVCAL